MNDKIYIGHTVNLDLRIKRYNGLLKNKAKSYTSKNSGSWVLVYNEEFVTRKEAVLKEKQLKSFRGREFVRKMIDK